MNKNEDLEFLSVESCIFLLNLKDKAELKQLRKNDPTFPEQLKDESGRYYIWAEVDEWGENSGYYAKMRKRLPDPDKNLNEIRQRFKLVHRVIQLDPEQFGAIYKTGTKAERKAGISKKEQTGILEDWKLIPDARWVPIVDALAAYVEA